MAKISFYLRTPNGAGMSPVTVRHSHKGSNFPLASGELVLEAFFDKKKGQVSEKHPDCAKINAGIRRVVSRMEQARDACQKNKVEPVREHMEHYYELLVKQEAVRAESEEHLAKATPTVLVPDLRKQLAKREEEIQQIKGLLRQLDPNSEGDLISTYFDQYVQDRKDMAENSHIAIRQAKDRCAKFNPMWRMQEVNEESLRVFEQWMIEKNYSTNTIILTFERLKAVCYCYAKKLKLHADEIRQHRRDTKSVTANKNGMVTLTVKQINAVLALELKGEQARTRDQFVLLCLTGLRYSDSLRITPDLIHPRVDEDGVPTSGVELVLPTLKTDQEVVIPLSEKLHNLLVRNNFDFIRKKRDPKTGERVNVKDWKKSSNFNRVVRSICSQIPSLQGTVRITSQKGGKTLHKTVRKHEAVRSHTGRKSMVNNAMKIGVNPVVVAGIAGQKSVNLIMNTYGDPNAGAEKLMDM